MTLCVSTQVGCPVACVFCASGLFGVRRNLLAGEIVEQVLLAQSLLGADQRLTHLVVMGMGEPMLNLPALLPALERISDNDGIGFGARRITVSTSGYPQRIAEFARQPRSYNLAISLHAADDRVRKRLVPTATATVAELVEAARGYLERKGRQVTFEVVLLAEVNDQRRHATELVRALHRVNCTVNLIPWNRVAEIQDLATPSAMSVNRFAGWLRADGLNVTVRSRRGAEQNAACGQLRIRAMGER
jgi:23S rRNA (adenine2503-C2)-methyltransferase